MRNGNEGSIGKLQRSWRRAGAWGAWPHIVGFHNASASDEWRRLVAAVHTFVLVQRLKRNYHPYISMARCRIAKYKLLLSPSCLRLFIKVCLISQYESKYEIGQGPFALKIGVHHLAVILRCNWAAQQAECNVLDRVRFP